MHALRNNTAAAAAAATASPQRWPTTVALLLAVALASLAALFVARRPAFPGTAPPLIDGGGYPVLGMWRFFSDRRNFMRAASRATASGHFSFYVGKLQVVGVSGEGGRRALFESRDLNMFEGYAVLFANTPQVDIAAKGRSPLSFNRWFAQTIAAMVRAEALARSLPQLVGDARGQLAAIVARTSRSRSRNCLDGAAAGVFDPFDDIYRTVYHLTMRTVGANDIADDPALLAKTLRLFEAIDSSGSPTRVVFPWLPTPGHLQRVLAGFRLFLIVRRIAKDRQRTGRRQSDALQSLLDSGETLERVLTFVLAALFAGLLNSGINAAWFFVYLACHPDWYARVQQEVDSAVARYRASPRQSASDVLATLTLGDWESAFPLVDLCLRECIRLQIVGTVFRKNVAGKDVPIGGTGEAIPRGAFAVYLVDDVHMDPDVYPDPERWDPGRYLAGRAEDKKVPLGYLGWGTGRHPCLGMRFAKLEMAIIAAYFVAAMDFELVNAAGERLAAAPRPNRNYHSASRPDERVLLRYRLRGQ